jgi:formylmethanofuran dehydrogenase subunit C
MRTITIAPIAPIKVSVEAENISPDRFAPLTLDQIRSLGVWYGNRKMRLCDLFLVEGDDSPAKPEEVQIRVRGDFSRVKRIGEGMSAGTVEADGHVGMHAGNNMKGGLLTVQGDADDWLAREIFQEPPIREA